MLHIPVLRWGEPYKSLEIDKVVHFATGEALAEVSRANAGLVERDMRQAKRAREVLRDIPIKELLETVKKAADPSARFIASRPTEISSAKLKTTRSLKKKSARAA